MSQQPYVRPTTPTVPVIPVRPQIPLPFRHLGVKYSPRGGTEVVWALHRWFSDPLPHTFQLQWARSPQADAGWSNIGLPASNVDHLVDDEPRNWAANRDVWFRIVLETPAAQYPSSPIQPGNLLQFYPWRLSRDIIRKELMLARQYTGVNCLYLKRRRYGPQCPSCLDPGTQETINDRCTRCYGTAYDGGYYAPRRDVYVTFGLAAVHETTDMEAAGTVQPEGLEACRIIGDPIPDSDDVIVDVPGGRRFYVHKRGRVAEKNGYTLVVELELRPADFSDVIYDFPVSP